MYSNPNHRGINMLAYCATLILSFVTITLQAQKNAAVWLTDPGNKVLFSKQPFLEITNRDGFGYTLTGGSAQHTLTGQLFICMEERLMPGQKYMMRIPRNIFTSPSNG